MGSPNTGSRPSAVVLKHYGVKGMRWGKRKPGTGEASTHVKRSDDHPDHKETRELKREKPRTLSNQEIQRINKRLQLERTYAELNAKQNPINKGHDAVKSVLAVTATASAAYAFTQSPLGKELIKAVKLAATK